MCSPLDVVRSCQHVQESYQRESLSLVDSVALSDKLDDSDTTEGEICLDQQQYKKRSIIEPEDDLCPSTIRAKRLIAHFGPLKPSATHCSDEIEDLECSHDALVLEKLLLQVVFLVLLLRGLHEYEDLAQSKHESSLHYVGEEAIQVTYDLDLVCEVSLLSQSTNQHNEGEQLVDKPRNQQDQVELLDLGAIVSHKPGEYEQVDCAVPDQRNEVANFVVLYPVYALFVSFQPLVSLLIIHIFIGQSTPSRRL